MNIVPLRDLPEQIESIKGQYEEKILEAKQAACRKLQNVRVERDEKSRT